MAPRDGQSTQRPPDPTAPKRFWRAWARETRAAWAADGVRRAADERALQALLSAWGAWRSARIALVYLPYGDEPNPFPTEPHGPLRATTRTVGGDAPLQLRMLVEPLEPHPLGFAQPRAEAPPVDLLALDLVVVPGLAFDRAGTRLGYGKGHYDRLLPTLPGHLPKVGVTVAPLLLPQLPSEAHDVRMTHLLTPEGIAPIAGR